MEPVTGTAYRARLRVGNWLPTWLLVPLVFVRNVALGAYGFSGDPVAPARIEVFRLSDGTVVGTIAAGAGYYEQAHLLADVRQALATETATEFFAAWRLDEVEVPW